MVNREKIEQKAKVALEKGEILMENERFRRAADSFRKAGELFYSLQKWKVAEQCFYYAGKNYNKLEDERNFQRAALMEREAGKCCTYLHNFSKAQEYFNVSGKTELKAEEKSRPEFATEVFSFAFLCSFLQGKMDEAINLIKRVKNRIPATLYTDHPLMTVVRRITNAHLKRKEAYLDEILDSFHQLKYAPAELLLIKEAVIVSLTALMMEYSMNLTATEFERDEEVEVISELTYSKLSEFQSYSIVPRTFTSIKIIDVHIDLDENMITKNRPSFPIVLDLKEYTPIPIPFSFRTNFPGKSFIGPISLTIEIEGIYRFTVKSERQDINITSPQAVLGIDLKPLKTPIINQTFPLQVLLSNKSDGNAMKIDVAFEFPEELRLMRGTLEKTIYTLSPNEDIAWNIQVKAFDVGKLPIKATVAFQDEDGNKKGPFSAELPLEINM